MTAADITTGVYLDTLRAGKLLGARCRDCGATALPPRPVCGHCHGDNLELIAVDGRGKLVAFSVITVGNRVMTEAGHDRANPSCSGIVELAPGLRLPARISGADTAAPENIRLGASGVIEPLVGEDNSACVTFRLDP